ncbi:MAG: hypothetical protein DCC49_12975 [Acidobacteria bacterium]|nr:MAG: hypothetical protein DCC49_12975 [Acidobacteriota bacterium]
MLIIFPPWTFLGEFDGYHPIWSPPFFAEHIAGHTGRVNGQIAYVRWLVPIIAVIALALFLERFVGRRSAVGNDTNQQESDSA